MADFAKFSINNHTYDVKDTVARGDIANLQTSKEDAANKVTSIDSSSTDTEFPSAKAVYDAIKNNDLFVEITYGSTTVAEIDAILANGQFPYLYFNNTLMLYSIGNATHYAFASIYCHSGLTIYGAVITKGTGTWSYYGYPLTTVLSSASTHQQFPTAKAVYDYASPKLYRHKITIYYDDQGDAAQVAFSVILSRSTAYTTADAATMLTDLKGLTFAASGSFDSTGGDTCRLVTVEIESTMNIATIGYDMNAFTMDDRSWAPNDIDTLTDIVEAL